MLGQALRHYRIIEKLGEGGMGVVYKARDTHLDRFVAIKVLPAEKLADPSRKARFVQEAKAASALNHPNIITIYDISSDTGRDFIAMEYVAGKTLDQLIARKGMRLSEALKIAVQIADALSRAHAAGIIHRDLKPANIMVDEHGLVKVLDFGLAKLTEREADELAPTETLKPQTEEGKVVGTAGYMSPEQAEGRKLDPRSDVFSFGSVLYEMVTGRRAFRGDSKMATMSAILREEPAPVEDAPPELEKLITRCLRKDPERRAQHMADVKLALEELKEESESGKLARPAAAHPRVFRWTIPVLVCVMAAVAGVTWWLSRSPRPTPPPFVTRLTSDSGLTTDPALSPDGKLLAFASDRAGRGNLDIWVQHLPGGEPIQITRDEANESEPSFSPDGSRVAFRSEREAGGVYVISSLGGEPRKVADRGRTPRFSPDGQWIAYWVGPVTETSGTGFGRLYVAPASGGSPREIRPDFDHAAFPNWSPDGKRLLFVGGPLNETSDWWVTPLLEGAPVATGARHVFPRHGLTDLPKPSHWIGRENQVVFASRSGANANIWRLSLTVGTWRAKDDLERVTFGTTLEMQPALAGERLVFASSTEQFGLWSLPIDANQGKVLGDPEALTHDLTLNGTPSVTPDGRKVVFVSSQSGNMDVWVRSLPGGKETQLTITPVDENRPQISRDGTRVAYGVGEEGKARAYVVSADGGPPQRVCEECVLVRGWSSDGTSLLFGYGEPKRVAMLNVDTGRKTDLARHPQYALYSARFSPDDRWITFIAQLGTGRTRVFVAPVRPENPPKPEEWITVTEGDQWDDKPGWSPDGNQLYFLSERDGYRCLWARRLDSVTRRPVAPPFAVYHSHSASCSLLNVPLALLEISIARDKVVFNMGERTGNIWMAEWKQGR